MNGPLWLSLEIASIATLLTTLLALPLASLVSHRRLFVLDALLTTPLVLPPTVLGYFLLVVMGNHTVIGRAWQAVFGSSLVFTTTGIVFAAVITSLPLVLQATRAAIEGVDVTLINAARTLGANRFKTYTRITLPLASRGMCAGIVLGFARALGDFGVTMMVGGNLPGETRTASLAIYDAFIADRATEALHLSLMLAGFSIVLVSVATLLGRRPHAHA